MKSNIIIESTQIYTNKKDNNNQHKKQKTMSMPQKHWLKRIWKKPILMHYHRLFALVILTNIIVLMQNIEAFSIQEIINIKLSTISNLILFNLFVAVIIRQHYVINLLFWIATSVPKSWPLSVRAFFGKVYHFGGLHSGSATAATFWFCLFSFKVYQESLLAQSYIPSNLIISTLILNTLLILLIIMALPKVRSRFHNQFEIVHRLGGWSVLLLFWYQTINFIKLEEPGKNLLTTLLSSLDFWALCIITLSIILPWLRLKKVPIKIVKPSSHAAITEFDYGVTPFAGSSTALSRNPLFEWHSFANAPSPDKEGFRLVISRAGDWTGRFIDEQPSHIWVKGIPTAGVGNVELLFKKVIWVATGSGIGPCLPHLLSQKIPSKLVWVTRNPRKTYGDALVDELLKVQPDALIWNSDEKGKPDMVKLAYQATKEFNAEAVICIANQKLTWKVVYGMESRGIPAYGAIWDS